MNKIETKQLLDEIAAIDNRQVTPEVIEAWHAIIKHIPLEIAQEAHRIARRNEQISRLEPKHILGRAQEAAYSLDRQKPKVDYERPIDVAPQPICREHKKKIMTCDPCCRKLSRLADRPAAEILAYAKQNVYA